MKRYAVFTVGFAALTVGLVFVTSLQASVTVPNPWSTTLDPTTGWPAYTSGPLGTGGVLQGTKVWQFQSSNLATTTPINISYFTQGTIDNHGLQMASLASPLQGANTYTLNYWISVDATNPANALAYIFSASLDVEADDSKGRTPPGVWSVTKSLYSSLDTSNPANFLGTLTVNQGTPGGTDSITFAGQKFIDVVETLTLDANTTFTSVTNTFIESRVPEPATLVVWSLLGALAIGLGWWRKRKAA